MFVVDGGGDYTSRSLKYEFNSDGLILLYTLGCGVLLLSTLHGCGLLLLFTLGGGGDV